MVTVYHPDATGVSFQGENFERQADGSFEVPDEAVADLCAGHGFTTTPPTPAEPAPAPLTGHPAQWPKEALTAEAIRLGIDPEQPRKLVIREVAAARKVEADAALTEAEQE
jgi:hypothetical protein